MSNADAANNLLGGGKAFPFDNIGDTAKGQITNLDTSQAIDFDTKKPRVYDNGDPIMQIVVTLLIDEEEYLIFGKPAIRNAIREARDAAGVKKIEVGGTLAVQFYAEEPSEQKGKNPKKLYKAQYQPPAAAAAVSANDLI